MPTEKIRRLCVLRLVFRAGALCLSTPQKTTCPASKALSEHAQPQHA
ncbi:MAG TPA: hypothetical protein VFN13_02120 [Rudaea sp.]|nr:hypothetical protein [Rudaea sp.]